jgi:HSP20 family protein
LKAFTGKSIACSMISVLAFGGPSGGRFSPQKRYFGGSRRGRSFELPNSVDADKIEASFKKGVLIVKLPKKVEAQKPAKKIEVKAA